MPSALLDGLTAFARLRNFIIEYYNKMFASDGSYIPSIIAQSIGGNNTILDTIIAPNAQERVQAAKDIIRSMDGFAITITFTDRMLFEYREKALLVAIYNRLNKIRNILQFCFVSDWSRNGRFHLHGTIKLKDFTKIQYIKNKLRPITGIVKAVLITNTNIWADYCVQQYTEEGKKDIKILADKALIIRRM